jgi:hypothetical protein
MMHFSPDSYTSMRLILDPDELPLCVLEQNRARVSAGMVERVTLMCARSSASQLKETIPGADSLEENYNFQPPCKTSAVKQG